MQIDCYGFEATSQWFKRRSLKPHLIKDDDGVLYISFGYSPHGPIHRIDWNRMGTVPLCGRDKLMFLFSEFALVRVVCPRLISEDRTVWAYF